MYFRIFYVLHVLKNHDYCLIKFGLVTKVLSWKLILFKPELTTSRLQHNIGVSSFDENKQLKISSKIDDSKKM